MALSYISSQRRPSQGECRRRFPLSTTQQRVRLVPFPLCPLCINHTNLFSQLRPLQRGTRKQPRISHTIPTSTLISITRNQTPSTTTSFLNKQGLVASLTRRPDRPLGMSLPLILLPPTTGPASISTTSSPPLVHSLRDTYHSPPTFTSRGSPIPPLNRVC